MSNKKRITVKIDTTYKYVAKKLNIVDYNTLNNYVKLFKKKGVIIKKGKDYAFNKLLDPTTASVEIFITK